MFIFVLICWWMHVWLTLLLPFVFLTVCYNLFMYVYFRCNIIFWPKTVNMDSTAATYIDSMDLYSTNTTKSDENMMKLNIIFAWLLFSLISGMVWVIYITYYNSRVTAYIVTRLLTKFYATKGYLSIGKLHKFNIRL